MCHALYEPVNPGPTNAVVGTAPVTGPDNDLIVEWTEPTIAVGTGFADFYVYKWNTSSTALSDTALSRTVNDGTVSLEVDPPHVTTLKSFFASDNFNTLRYLHIKTAYTTYANGPLLSTDTVVGPFNFDNVAPTCTIGLDPDATGQTSTTSSVNPVTLKLTPGSEPIATVYLSNTTTKPGTGVDFDTSLSHEVTEGTGSRTVYAWFEDQAGNVSAQQPVTFTIIAGATIDPAGDFEMGVGNTQVFAVQGGVGPYDWAFVVRSPEDVATFTTATADAYTVTVSADKEGIFQVTASSNGQTYTSGTVTAVKTTLTKTFNLITTETTNTNTIGFIFEDTGITTAHELGTAVGSCTQVAKWDAQTSRISPIACSSRH